MEELKHTVIAVDMADKNGDYSCMVEATYNKITKTIKVNKIITKKAKE